MENQLTSDQYQQILKYMEATSQQDFQAATLILKQYNFNLNTAINAKFNRNQQTFNSANQQSANRQNRNVEVPGQNDEQILRKFIIHLQKQNQNWSLIGSTYSFVKNLTWGIIKLFSQIILPQSLLRRFLRSNFYVLYKNQIKVNIQDSKLNSILMKTKQITHKSCFLVLSPNKKCQSIIQLLNNGQIVKKLQDNFIFAGFVSGDSDLQNINNQNPPEIIICRYNVYKQFIILKRFVGQEQITSITTQKLDNLTQQSRNCQKRDKNVLVKYRNLMRRQYYGPMYQDQEQQEQINFQVREQSFHEIKNQNEQYKRVEQQEMKRMQQIRQQQVKRREQQQKHNQRQEERKVRKISIPDEPIEGEVIRFLFRCPDGSTKSRGFLAQQKVELLYNWVQTNQQIELQDNKKRQFEILYSYPPTPLKDMKEKLLKQVFDSDQEKVLIRQL